MVDTTSMAFSTLPTTSSSRPLSRNTVANTISDQSQPPTTNPNPNTNTTNTNTSTPMKMKRAQQHNLPVDTMNVTLRIRPLKITSRAILESQSSSDTNDMNEGGQGDDITTSTTNHPDDFIGSSVTMINDTSVRLVNTEDKTYSCSKVFGPRSSQIEIYKYTTAPMVEKVFRDHSSGLIFAYGVTASGKTHTMQGTKSQPGIIGNLLDDVFQRLDTMKENNSSTNTTQDATINTAISALSLTTPPQMKVLLSCYEIYLDKVYDLLAKPTSGSQNDLPSLRISSINIPATPDSPSYMSSTIIDLTEVNVNTSKEALSYLALSQQRRRTASTGLNADSSRSHSITQLQFISSTDNVTLGKISIVDLAGSERTSKIPANMNPNIDHQYYKDRQRETNHINTSLTALQSALKRLNEKQAKENLTNTSNTNNTGVGSLRDHPLTQIFAQNLSGCGPTSMICCINPSPEEVNETKSTLGYAMMAKEINYVSVIKSYINTSALTKDSKDTKEAKEREGKENGKEGRENRENRDLYLKNRENTRVLTPRHGSSTSGLNFGLTSGLGVNSGPTISARELVQLETIEKHGKEILQLRYDLSSSQKSNEDISTKLDSIATDIIEYVADVKQSIISMHYDTRAKMQVIHEKYEDISSKSMENLSQEYNSYIDLVTETTARQAKEKALLEYQYLLQKQHEEEIGSNKDTENSHNGNHAHNTRNPQDGDMTDTTFTNNSPHATTNQCSTHDKLHSTIAFQKAKLSSAEEEIANLQRKLEQAQEINQEYERSIASSNRQIQTMKEKSRSDHITTLNLTQKYVFNAIEKTRVQQQLFEEQTTAYQSQIVALQKTMETYKSSHLNPNHTGNPTSSTSSASLEAYRKMEESMQQLLENFEECQTNGRALLRYVAQLRNEVMLLRKFQSSIKENVEKLPISITSYHQDTISTAREICVDNGIDVEELFSPIFQSLKTNLTQLFSIKTVAQSPSITQLLGCSANFAQLLLSGEFFSPSYYNKQAAVSAAGGGGGNTTMNTNNASNMSMNITMGMNNTITNVNTPKKIPANLRPTKTTPVKMDTINHTPTISRKIPLSSGNSSNISIMRTTSSNLTHNTSTLNTVTQNMNTSNMNMNVSMMHPGSLQSRPMTPTKHGRQQNIPIPIPSSITKKKRPSTSMSDDNPPPARTTQKRKATSNNSVIQPEPIPATEYTGRITRSRVAASAKK